MKIKILFTLMMLFAAAIVRGQADDFSRNEVTVWGGFSPDSSTLIRAFGRIPNARLGIIGLRYARRFDTSKKLNLKYTADLVPAAFLSVPESTSPAAVRRSAYAFGFSPLGMQANFRPRKKYQPFAEISGGFLFFNKAIPNDLGKRFNFTANVGAGVEIRLENKRAVTLGYKYYHISNGNRGRSNPGIDNNLLYVGYTFFSK